MTDKFDEFETFISSWISRHKILVFIIGFFILGWLSVSMMSTSIYGNYGIYINDIAIKHGYYANNTPVCLLNGSVNGNQTVIVNGISTNVTYTILVSDEQFNNYNMITLPMLLYMNDTIFNLPFFIWCMYMICVGYFMIRFIYRRNANDR